MDVFPTPEDPTSATTSPDSREKDVSRRMNRRSDFVPIVKETSLKERIIQLLGTYDVGCSRTGIPGIDDELCLLYEFFIIDIRMIGTDDHCII